MLGWIQAAMQQNTIPFKWPLSCLTTTLGGALESHFLELEHQS